MLYLFLLLLLYILVVLLKVAEERFVVSLSQNLPSFLSKATLDDLASYCSADSSIVITMPGSANPMVDISRTDTAFLHCYDYWLQFDADDDESPEQPEYDTLVSPTTDG
jgi:hypothetical protein